MFYIIHLCFYCTSLDPEDPCHTTFNNNVFGCPLLVEGGEAAMLTDADNMLSEVEVLGIKAEQAEPQLPHRLSVPPTLWPATGLQAERQD